MLTPEQRDTTLPNSEIARRLACEFDQRCHDLRDLFSPYPHLLIKKPTIEIRYTRACLAIRSDDEPIDGLGMPIVWFDYDPMRTITPRFQEELGIDTPNSLRLFLHTDEQTRPQMEALVNENPEIAENSRGPKTTYYFDAAGNYKKAVHLTHGIRDPRPSLYNYGIGSALGRIVRGEMTMPEFELVGFVIQSLERNIRVQLAEATFSS